MGLGRMGLAGLTAAVLGLTGLPTMASPTPHAAAEAALGTRPAATGRGTAATVVTTSGSDLTRFTGEDDVIEMGSAQLSPTGTADARAAATRTAATGTAGFAAAAATRPHRGKSHRGHKHRIRKHQGHKHQGHKHQGHKHQGHKHRVHRNPQPGGTGAATGHGGSGPTARPMPSAPTTPGKSGTKTNKNKAGGNKGTRNKASKTKKSTKTKAGTPIPGTVPPNATNPGTNPATAPDQKIPKSKLPKIITLTGPALMLATGIAALKGTGYDIDETIGGGGNLALSQHGSVDPTGHSANLDATGTQDGVPVHTDVRQIGSQLWTLMDLGPRQSTVGGDPKKWMTVDRGELNRPDDTLVNLSGDTDPLDIAGLMAKVTNLEQAAPTYVTGFVDLTASTGVSAPAPEQLAFAGEPAAVTPFTAEFDDQGRLVQLRIEADSISPDLSRTFTFSRFGAPSPVAAPPANQVIDAPDSVYQYFNGR